MKRRDMLKSLLAAQLFSGAAAGQDRKGTQIWPPPARRTDGAAMPNILWICPDQQRFDTIEGLNNTYIHTPNLRRLTEQSVTLTHAYVQNPVCSPSRASFLTGRYPHTTGLRANGQRIRPSERLVTRILADYGYECGLVGKLHLSPVLSERDEDRIDDGYDRFYWSHDPWLDWPGKNKYYLWLESQGVKRIKISDIPRLPGASGQGPWGVPIDSKFTQTAWCADVAINFIRTQRNLGPWLMSVNIFNPHHPFCPPKEYYDRYDPDKLPSPPYQKGELATKSKYQQEDHENSRNLSFTKTDDLTHRRITAAYYAMIEEIDFHVGRILQALDETGQADNTIVIFMSDHGELLGDHGLYLKGPHLYEGGMRVPLIIRWPGQYKAGLKSDALVEMVDLVPTILDACGIPISPGVQGKSLTKLLKGETVTHRDSVYAECYDSGRLYDPPPMLTMVRDRGHKLIYYHSLHFAELYDLEKDPGEVRNIWSSPQSAGLRETMMQLMLDRMAETVDPLPRRKAEA